MGYLADNIPLGENNIDCQDIYPFRIIVKPRFASDRELQTIILDELADVENWQFSGRRFCPVTDNNARLRVVHPAMYAQNSRKVRQFVEEVVFAFRSQVLRTQVSQRLSVEGFKFRLVPKPEMS